MKRQIVTTAIAAVAFLLAGGAAMAHNQASMPDCPVSILKKATAKPDVLLSLDASCSMGWGYASWNLCNGPKSGSPMQQAVDVIKCIVTDPVVGGQAINYGYQEWSSNRTSSCASSIRVPIINDADQSAAIVADIGGASYYGGTPQNAALLQAYNYYANTIIPNDTVTCRKRFVLMITDGMYNCSGNPCPTASNLGALGVPIIAVAAFGAPISAVACMANNSGGTAVSASNATQLMQVLQDQLGQTLSGTVTVGPSVQGTIKDPMNPDWRTVTGNANIVAPVELPTFRGHFKAFNLFFPDPADPTKTKLKDDIVGQGFRLLWDADVVNASVPSGSRQIFTQDKWATCYQDPKFVIPPPPSGGSLWSCASGPPSGGFNRVNFTAGLGNADKLLALPGAPANASALVEFIRGKQVNTSTAPWTVGGEKSFKLYALLANGGSIMIPPQSNIDDSDYTVFRDLYKQRETVYFVESDSGGVHAFSAQTLNGKTGGREKWMFVPRENLSRLKNLLLNPQDMDSYTYLAQGRTEVFDLHTDTGWKTVLVLGLGAGGRSYYALDVTEPNDSSNQDKLPPIMWAFTAHNNPTPLPGGRFANVPGDFGNMGLAMSSPAINDPRMPNCFPGSGGWPGCNSNCSPGSLGWPDCFRGWDLVVGSGMANDQLSQPQSTVGGNGKANPACVGTGLADPSIGHVIYNINASTGALKTFADVRSLGNIQDPLDPMHDILRSQVNGINRIASAGLENSVEIDNLETGTFGKKFVLGGSLGHLFQWDGTYDPAGLIHLTSAAAVSTEDPTMRPITSMPLVFSPNLIDTAGGQANPCQVAGQPVNTAAYFGTGDEASAQGSATQYIYGVDVSGPAFPSFTQLPGSPIALNAREYVIGEPLLVRVPDINNQLMLNNVVMFLTFTAAPDACGSGYSTLYTLNACNPAIGGWDANGDGNVTAVDRTVDLGAGRATGLNVAEGKLIVTEASGFLDLTPDDGMTEPPKTPVTETWNWKILD